MKRSLITSSLAALSVAFLLPMGAHAATTTNATAAKHTTVAKTAAAAKSTTAAKTESATPAKNATATKTHRHATAKNAAAAKPTKIDINTATREELMTLPGIDGDMADKIIAGRPYKNMAQLKTKGGVTNAEYRKINRKVTAKQSAMHSEAPANGTQSENAANASGGEGAAGTSGSSDQTTK